MDTFILKIKNNKSTKRQKKKELKLQVSDSYRYNHSLDLNRNRRIDLTGDLTSKYTFYLCFSVKYKTHKLVHYHNLKYSENKKNCMI